MTNLRNTTALTGPNYRALPQRPPPKLYSGPAVPTAYDPQWRTYTNLLSDPKYAAAGTLKLFQDMPETCQQVARDLRHGQVLGVMPKITSDMTLAQVQAALDTAKTAVAAPFATEQSVLANIGTKVHNQDDVVKAFGAKQ